MHDPQDLFNQLQEIKQQQKEIRKEYTDLLAQDGEYQQVKEEYDTIRLRKKEFEQSAQIQMGDTYAKLDDLKNERAAIEEMLSDIVITNMMKGESTQITDADHNEYEPRYNVSFKKIG
jgi:predicted nuclease with TOPRIM domain